MPPDSLIVMARNLREELERLNARQVRIERAIEALDPEARDPNGAHVVRRVHWAFPQVEHEVAGQIVECVREQAFPILTLEFRSDTHQGVLERKADLQDGLSSLLGRDFELPEFDAWPDA